MKPKAIEFLYKCKEWNELKDNEQLMVLKALEIERQETAKEYEEKIKNILNHLLKINNGKCKLVEVAIITSLNNLGNREQSSQLKEEKDG